MILQLRKHLHAGDTSYHLEQAIQLPGPPPLPFKIVFKRPMFSLFLVTDVVFDPDEPNEYHHDAGWETVKEEDCSARLVFYRAQGWVWTEVTNQKKAHP